MKIILIGLFKALKETKIKTNKKLTNKNSKYLLYWFNDYLERLLQPIKPFLHSVITYDDLVLDIIHNENWQYFIETILAAFKTNNGGINNTIDLKNINSIKSFL